MEAEGSFPVGPSEGGNDQLGSRVAAAASGALPSSRQMQAVLRRAGLGTNAARRPEERAEVTAWLYACATSPGS